MPVGRDQHHDDRVLWEAAKPFDEIPAAYNDIDQVMANQADLVEVLRVLKPVPCVKG